MSRLVIEIQYAGLGDHLFHSHLPRIAKETKKYNSVFISLHSKFGHEDYKKLIWQINPYIDGFIDEPGVKCDIGEMVKKVSQNSETNLLDQVMYFYGLDNGKTWNEPEVFYKPSYYGKYNHVIYDPNFVSWIGNVTEEDAMMYFNKNNITFDFIMKLRGTKKMYIPNESSQFIETPTLEEFCDLIHSSKKFYCLTSGAATLASALGKQASVFWGTQQEDGFKHSKLHTYHLIPRYTINRVKRKLNLAKKFF